MSRSHGSSRLGIQLAQVGRFTFALIVGALFGVAAWESPRGDAEEPSREFWFSRESSPHAALHSSFAHRSSWAFDDPATPSESSDSAIPPIGEAANNKSHTKPLAAAAMPLRWSIEDEVVPSQSATAQHEKVAVRAAELHSRGPPARRANRSDDAHRADQSPERSGD